MGVIESWRFRGKKAVETMARWGYTPSILLAGISYEARKLLREFFEYADDKRMKGEFDVTQIVHE